MLSFIIKNIFSIEAENNGIASMNLNDLWM